MREPEYVGTNDSDMPTMAGPKAAIKRADSEAPTLANKNINAEDVAREVERRAALLSAESEPPTLADNDLSVADLEREIARLLASGDSEHPTIPVRTSSRAPAEGEPEDEPAEAALEDEPTEAEG
jgi:hypothetical protein